MSFPNIPTEIKYIVRNIGDNIIVCGNVRNIIIKKVKISISIEHLFPN